MSVSTSALYAIMFLCAAFVFSFLFRVLRALLLHPALLAPLVRRSDGPDSTINAEGQRETDREVEKARAAEAVREQGSEGVVWRGGSGDPCECLVQTQAQARQEKHETRRASGDCTAATTCSTRHA
ncbi:hypothetical protein CLOM_g2125 [Closterium sp. NIES-68]|nr:hypothetical protein CLOM_g2125 [Closterium sp. NIES-68]